MFKYIKIFSLLVMISFNTLNCALRTLALGLTHRRISPSPLIANVPKAMPSRLLSKLSKFEKWQNNKIKKLEFEIQNLANDLEKINEKVNVEDKRQEKEKLVEEIRSKVSELNELEESLRKDYKTRL